MVFISITKICEETTLDNILKKVATAITIGDISIMGNETSNSKHIFSELTVSKNGLVLKGK